MVRAQENLTLIPYYAWANRGRGQMMVWIPDTEASAHPLNPATATTDAKVTTDGRKSPNPVKDEDEPASSTMAAVTSTGGRGDLGLSSGWMEYAFDKPAAVIGKRPVLVRRYRAWKRARARIMANLYRDGDEWKPVESRSVRSGEGQVQ